METLNFVLKLKTILIILFIILIVDYSLAGLPPPAYFINNTKTTSMKNFHPRWVSHATSALLDIGGKEKFEDPDYWAAVDACVGTSTSTSVVIENGQKYSSVGYTIPLNKGAQLCLLLDGRPYTMTVKNTREVYKLKFKRYCGSWNNKFNQVPDSRKPNNNGFSCHCPGSLSSAEFEPCSENKTPTSELDFFAEYNNTAEFHHEICLLARGNTRSKGCFEESDTHTYYKASIPIDIHTMMEFEKDVATEVVMQVVDPDGRQEEIIMSPKSRSNSQTGVIFTTTVENMLKHSFSGKSLVWGSESNKDVSNLYLFDDDYINPPGIYDHGKMCSIQYGFGLKLETDLVTLQQRFADFSTTNNCDPATGNFGLSLKSISDNLNPAHKLTSYLDPSLMAYSQAYGSLFVLDSGTLYGNILFPGAPNVENTVQVPVLALKSVNCKPSQNLDGFPCTIVYDNSGQSGEIVLFDRTSERVILSFMTTTGLSLEKSFMINPNLEGNNTLELCIGSGAVPGAVNDGTVCRTTKVTYNITDFNPGSNTTETPYQEGTKKPPVWYKNSEGSVNLTGIFAFSAIGIVSFFIFICLAYVVYVFGGALMKYAGSKLPSLKEKWSKLKNYQPESEIMV